MPIVTMPNGDRVNFPDTMSREEIRSKILEKFPEADPDRGVLAKTTEFGRGEARGLAQDMAASGRVLSHLPRGALPFPGMEPAAQLIRAFGPAAGRWGDQPVGSGYEQTGRFVGRDVLPMFAPGGAGGPIGGAIGRGGMRAFPTLLQLAAFLHNPIAALAGRTVLHEAGMLPKIQELANALVGPAGALGRAVGHATERVAQGEAGQYIPGAPEDAETPPDPTPPPAAAPSSPAVPAPAQPRTAPGAPRPGPGQDADTDAPVANRSGRGDRLNVYGGSAN